jgi:4'-phosphopantetheinyl transferase
MIEISIMHIQEVRDSKSLEYYLKDLPKEIQRKVMKFHFEDDRKRSLLGYMMSRYMLKKFFHLKDGEIIVEKNEYGKPFIKDNPEIHYNISHSKDYVICGVNDKEIGIDIEYMKDLDINIAERFFTHQEYLMLMSTPENEKLEMFYKLWTLKESYVKYRGTGLSLPLNSFSFEIIKGRIYFQSGIGDTPCFKNFNEIEDYQVSVCSKNRICNERLQHLKLENIE